jgi:hypothetical protein
MILDLETERAAGLDESQLAEQVMRLMHGEMCDGPVFPVGHSLNGYCNGCNARNVYGIHKRIPKPLAQVRDELGQWLRDQGYTVLTEIPPDRNCRLQLRHFYASTTVAVDYAKITDEPTALALAAVRLLEGKQDANTNTE